MCTHTHVLYLEGYFRDLLAKAQADFKIIAMSPYMMSTQVELSVLINNLLRGRGGLLREPCVIPRN